MPEYMHVTAMTNEQARTWLLHNDREAIDLWSTYEGGDLREAVQDNLNSFGYEGQNGPIIALYPIASTR